MIDLDIFGRGEIKRLNYELRQSSYKVQELENEVECLSRTEQAQRATIEYLMKEVRAADELIRQMKETEQKLFAMYNASEGARLALSTRLAKAEAKAAEEKAVKVRVKEKTSETDCRVADAPRNDRGDGAA